MSGSKKMTLKSLNEELERLKEQVKEVYVLKEKVDELEKTVEEFKRKHVADFGNKERESSEKFKCRKCNIAEDTAKKLKNHVQEKHPTKVDCDVCKNSFTKNSDLESHMKRVHQEAGKFECDLCDKKFILKWRLKKHIINHSATNLKGCHYYNNQKTCPFEELGCMFAHTMSGMCKFMNNCKNKLCSFQHEEYESESDNMEVEVKETSEESEDEDSCRCQVCGKIFMNLDKMLDHFDETNHN